MNLSRRFWVKNFVDFSHAQSQTKFTRVPFHPTVGLRAAPCVLCIVAIFSVSSASSTKAGYGLPTAATLTTLDTVDRMRTWCRCSVQTWQAVDTHLGKVPDATLLAMLPASSLKGGPSDLGHVRHRSSCRSCSASASSGTRQSSSYFEQKDQSAQRHRLDGRHRGRFDVQDRDRSNSFVPCSDDWGRAGRRMRTNWRTTCSHAGPHCQKGGVPVFRLQHSDPLQSDNAEAAEDLVADATGWNIQGAGRATPSFDSWKACWKVFRSILLMLRYPAANPTNEPLKVVMQSLEEYFERISRLNADYPETWHLMMRAEDKCRSEMFKRYRRHLTKAAGCRWGWSSAQTNHGLESSLTQNRAQEAKDWGFSGTPAKMGQAVGHQQRRAGTLFQMGQGQRRSSSSGVPGAMPGPSCSQLPDVPRKASQLRMPTAKKWWWKRQGEVRIQDLTPTSLCFSGIVVGKAGLTRSVERRCAELVDGERAMGFSRRVEHLGGCRLRESLQGSSRGGPYAHCMAMLKFHKGKEVRSPGQRPNTPVRFQTGGLGPPKVRRRKQNAGECWPWCRSFEKQGAPFLWKIQNPPLRG